MRVAIALLVAGALCLAYGVARASDARAGDARAAETDVATLPIWAIVVCPEKSPPRGNGCGVIADLPLQTRANCDHQARWMQANVMKPGHTAQCLADLDELRAVRGWR